MPGSLQKSEFSYAVVLYLRDVGASHLPAPRAAFCRGSRDRLCALCSRQGCREAVPAPGLWPRQGRECEHCSAGCLLVALPAWTEQAGSMEEPVLGTVLLAPASSRRAAAVASCANPSLLLPIPSSVLGARWLMLWCTYGLVTASLSAAPQTLT